MHNYLIEKPYEFVPRFRPQWLLKFLFRTGLLERTLRQRERVTEYDIHDAIHLKETLRSGHAVILVANHSRTADPLVLQFLARELGQPFYFMASSHVFVQGFFQRQILRWVGGFSVNREGNDRKAIDEAICILESAERPLVMFPEGTTSRTNERLADFLPGSLFIARLAASRRQKRMKGKVICHPLAITYKYQGDYQTDIAPTLTALEHRLGWMEQNQREADVRVDRICVALLRLQETYLELQPTNPSLPLHEAFRRVIETRLAPLEKEWGQDLRENMSSTPLRVRYLTSKIFPEMTGNSLSDEERKRRWKQLESLHFAQQLSRFEHRISKQLDTPDQLAETVENLHEILTGSVTHLGPWKASIHVGNAMLVPNERQRHQSLDPCLQAIHSEIQGMLDEYHDQRPNLHSVLNSSESPPVSPNR